MTDPTPDRPLVTFALFAYNQEKYIREAVEGAFSQTYEPLEIILSDDCSSDRTYEIMKEMASAYEGPHKVLVRRNKTNFGWASHINEVHKVACGEYITWSAGDDIALSDRTKVFADILINQKLNMVHSAVVKIDLEGKILGVKKHPSHVQQPSMNSVVTEKRGVVTQSFCFKKDAFALFSELSKDVTHEAIVYGFRAAALGKLKYIHEPLTKYRVGSGTSTQKFGSATLDRQYEATKVSGWRITALRQIRIDCKKLARLKENGDLELLIDSEMEKWDIIHSINKGGWAEIYRAVRCGYFLDKDVVRTAFRSGTYLLTTAR